mmetsp:Transcript_97457/g.281198  ORF Transcript_97457/g.281198 Transcript_97457/m.281198 type:complete len:384 (-) Transcript_97457:126-1277(-)
MIVTGIALEILAAAIGTTSKQLIANSGSDDEKQWMFYFGCFMNIILGPVVDASAYAFAPQVVVAPFACLDVIFNALSAPYTLGWQRERLTHVHFAATALVTCGAVFTAIFGSVHDEYLTVHDIEKRLLKPESLMYYLAEVSLMLGLNICLRAKVLSSTVRGISLGIVAGFLVGNAFCMKGFINIVRESLTTGDMYAWYRPTPYVLLGGAAAGAILGHLVMRRGLGEYKGVFMVTIFEGAHISAACLSGCVVMEEMRHAPWWQYILYWISIGVILSGMVLINTSATDSKLGSGRGFHLAQTLTDHERAGLIPKDASVASTRYRGVARDDLVAKQVDDAGVESTMEVSARPGTRQRDMVNGSSAPQVAPPDEAPEAAARSRTFEV